jgi:GT2 family glycosyltransferase
VDNASADGTPALLSSSRAWVEVICLPENRGFAAGCNVGIAAADHLPIVALINPDVFLDEGFFVRLQQLRWPADVAAVGPCIRGSDGSVEQSARRFPTASTGAFGRTTLLSRLLPEVAATRRQLLADPTRGTQEVDWVSGACLVISRSHLDAVGLLDANYFMYWEDADWCRRAFAQGLRIRYEPELEAVHEQGTSAATEPVVTIVAFHRSAYRYYRLHVGQSRLQKYVAGALLAARCVIKMAWQFYVRHRRRLPLRRTSEPQR